MKLQERKLFKIAVYIVAGYILFRILFSILGISLHFLTVSSIKEKRKDFVETFSYHNQSMDSVIKATMWYKRFESTSDRDSLLYYIYKARMDADSILKQPKIFPR